MGWVDSVGMNAWPVQDVQSICVCLTGLIPESDHHVSVEKYRAWSTELHVRKRMRGVLPVSVRSTPVLGGVRVLLRKAGTRMRDRGRKCHWKRGMAGILVLRASNRGWKQAAYAMNS